MAYAGCGFYDLELDTPSPVLLLDTGNAYFSDAVFSSIKGPPACGAVHVYAGAVAVQDSVWSGTDMSVEYDICLADADSVVYADSTVRVTNLEAGVEVGAADLASAEGHSPSFLRASDSALLQLVEARPPSCSLRKCPCMGTCQFTRMLPQVCGAQLLRRTRLSVLFSP